MSGPTVLVVGVGANIWPFHERALRAIDARVVGVHDINSAAATRIAEAYACPAPSTLEGLLELPADVAVILVPHTGHEEATIACLRAGLHVLVEKPIAVTAGEADRMVEAAHEAGRLLAVALQQRTREEVGLARQLIADGAIGDIQRVELVSTWPRRHAYFATAPWRATWRGEGGGILINQGQHDLDLVCLFAGSPTSVIGRTSNQFHATETEDTATALLGWSNGAVGTIHVTTAQDAEPQRIELTGTGGRIRLTPGCLEIWREAMDLRAWAASAGDPYERPTSSGPDVYPGAGGRHEDVYRNLAAALAGEELLVAPGSDALHAVELANAITYSSATGREVDLPLERGAYADLLERLRATSPRGSRVG